MFFASTGIDIGHLITFLFIGFVVAFAARGRELVATMSLGLFWGALTVVSFPAVVMRSGYGIALSRATVYFADSLAIVIAGVNHPHASVTCGISTSTSMICASPLTFDRRWLHSLVECREGTCRHLPICFKERSICLS